MSCEYLLTTSLFTSLFKYTLITVAVLTAAEAAGDGISNESSVMTDATTSLTILEKLPKIKEIGAKTLQSN